MDREEASRRGAAVADADLRPSARAHSPVGEVPRSVATEAGGETGGGSDRALAKVSLKGMRYADLERWLAEIGEKPSRATQVFNWMYRPGKLVADVRDMADVSAAFREKLASLATVDGDLEMRDVRTSADGTKKVTYALANGGGVVESVIIPSNVPGGRTTVCVSSQLGCAMNCQFCFTAKMGLRRNLTAAQIVEQVVHARRLAEADDEASSNVVFMGMGEPLHNIDAVLAAVDVLLDDRGLGFSKNKVTVSTSGLVPEIERYLAESQGSLAVSLNATTDEIRSWIMPINRKYNLERLLGALRANFPRRDGGRHQREVFFEYIMLEGVNDSAEDADRLVAIARTLPCKFNLIYFNTHDGSEFRCSDRETILAFRDRVVAAGVTCTIRQSRGDEEAAACGQLGSPDAMEDWKPSPPRMKRPKRLREMEMEAQ
ncbi:uncharacterized protein MICPUCDRAFT_12802 [Micromonas pusilla CCMP1545]|uniref:Predicted protein n=1 Tax=Micromonas pusilla (strain CCMP1545) TaxID=564608 RepID=C1MGU7_MICPC|nr:uncharacterized protein MICPUCDRAFT_12802 [Micromonas pusilla CCMP1545]EEH60633.1 predicted protein [Micromonas pusilla CCMP1545]|eukprot:XP_003055381.1 predicted protein [Micromonas pusilla CCMP1545]